jgi:fibronectin type 3 domain-containing protein
VNLSWQAPSGASAHSITGYNVYRGTSSGNESTTPIATSVTGTTYHDTATVSGTKYYYQVRAVSGTTLGLLSNEASAIAG